MRNDKQQQLTKFYPLQLTPKNNNRTIEQSNQPKSTKKQPSIIIFLQPTKTNETKGRLDLNRRNNTTTHIENRTIVINNLSPTSNPSASKKLIQTHLKYLDGNRRQPRNKYHSADANHISFKKHHEIINPYLPQSVHHHQNVPTKIPPNQTSSTKITPQESQIKSTRILKMRSPKDSPAHKYSKINDRHRERISSSKTKFPIIQNLPPTSRTE